ncbi:MAG: hypothetical protein ACRBC3_09725 [Burkholderiaceae bacterium]
MDQKGQDLRTTDRTSSLSAGWRRLSFGLLSILLLGLTGCAVVPGDSVIYEDARDYDGRATRSPDVVYIDRGPVYVWPGFRQHRRSVHRHRGSRRDYSRGHRSGGRSTWRGREGRRETRPNRNAGRPQVRPSPRAGRAVPVIPHKNERRSRESRRGGRDPGRSPTRRGSTSTGPAEGEG